MMFGVGAGVFGIIGDSGAGVSGDEWDIGTDSDDTAVLDSAGITTASDNEDDWGEMKVGEVRPAL